MKHMSSDGKNPRANARPAARPAPRQAHAAHQGPAPVAPHATTGATARYRMSTPGQQPSQPSRRPTTAPVAGATRPVAQGASRPATHVSSDAPRAVGETGAFSTISGAQGAVTANRGNAAEAARATKGRRARGARRSKRLSAAAGRNVSRREVALDDSQHSRKVTVALFVAAAVVVALVSFLLVRAWNSTSNEPEPSTRVERTDAKADQAVSYDGYSYSIQETSGKYAFVRTSGDDSDPLTLFELAGEPVGIVLCDGAYCIPENLSDGTWDVMAYAMGDGSVATQLMGSDGKAVTGTGKLKSAALDGTDLVLTDESDNQTRVPLK